MGYVIGIDPSSVKIAVSVLRDGRAVHSEWRPLPTDTASKMFKAMTYAQMLCKKWGLRAEASGTDLTFIIEDPIVGRGVYATIIQAKVHGALVAGAVSSTLVKNCETVAPSEWKKAILGKGNYPKDSIGPWLRTNWTKAFDMSTIPDHYDSFCIAQYGHKISTGELSRSEFKAKRTRSKKTTKTTKGAK